MLIQSLYPQVDKFRRYTNIYFGENQLFPSSISILPLTTGHPKGLQPLPVRASFRLSSEFTLPMVSSLGFGFSASRLYVALFRLGFPTPPVCKNLRLADDENSPAHSSIGTTLLACRARKSQYSNNKIQTKFKYQNSNYEILTFEIWKIGYCLRFDYWNLRFPGPTGKLCLFVSK